MYAGEIPPVAAGATPLAEEIARLEFRGSGAEYFRIWIVNLFLSIVTLGIYSAWAKVRRLRYFYGNTFVADSSFGYHADPKKILKGRIIAAALFLAYSLGGRISPFISIGAVLVFIVALPWIVVRSRMFQLRSTSYRNIRFGFDRCYRRAVQIYLGWGLALVATLWLLFPWWQARRYEFLVRNSRFGTTTFSVDINAKHFYAVYAGAALVGIGALFVGGMLATGIIPLLGIDFKAAAGARAGPTPAMYLIIAVIYMIMLPILIAIGSFLQSSIVNTTYNGTTLGRHGLQSNLRAWPLFRIYIGNLVLTVLTLGVYVPWARVRLARYRAESTALIVRGSLDDFVGIEAAAGAAVGEEIGDFFDVDFGL